MGFYALSSAWLFFLVIGLVVFYFLKLKRPRLDIPSLLLWRQVISDSRVNTPFQRFKRNLLLLLQLIILLLLILATLQPYWQGEAARAHRLPVLIDCSASMAALDRPGGSSRLQAAKEKVRALIEGLLPDQELCLITFGRTARKRTHFTNNKRILREALDSIQVEDVPSRIEDALRMTQALARTVTFEEVLLLSDGNFPAQADFELPFNLNYQQLPGAGPNIGITSLNARRSEDGNWDVFVSVEGACEAGAGVTVEFSRDGEIVGRQRVRLGAKKALASPQSANRSRRLILRIPGERASSLMVKLKPDSFDSLRCDNTAFLDIPAMRSLWVWTPRSMSSYRLALRGLSGIRLFPQEGSDEALDAYDLVITDSRGDLTVEGRTCFYVGLIPEDLKKLMSVTQDGSEVIDWRRGSGLLAHVELKDLVIIDQPRSKDGVQESDFENLGYEVLLHGERGPLLLEKRESTSGGEKLSFYLLFHSDRSTLPYRIGFPILLANLVQLAQAAAGLAECRSNRTGVLPALTLLADRLYLVEGPDGSGREHRSSHDGRLRGIPAPRVGIYEIREKGAPKTRVGASLLSTSETLLRAIDKIHFSELSVAAASAPLKTDKSLWLRIAMLAFCVLLGEWWYFNRRR